MSKHSFVPVTEISPQVDGRTSSPSFDEQNLIKVLEMSSDIVCVCKAGTITSVNSHGVYLLGAKNEDELIGKPFSDFLANEYSAAIDDFIAILAEETEPFPAKLITLEEKEIGVKINLYVAREFGDDMAIILARDVTNQVRMSEAIQRSEARYRKLINNALDLICTCKDGTINYINEAGVAMLGRNNSDEVVGKEISELFHPDYYEIFSENLDSLVAENMMFPTRIVRADNSYIDVEVGLSTIDISGSHLMIEARDITDHNQAVEALYQVNKNLEQRVEERTRELTTEISRRQKVEEQLRHSASHDGLTGLPNRGLLMDRISTALARGHREESRYALLFIDLDGFKALNDSLGHEAGDHLLIEAAHRISNHIRETDTAARIGGDEFVILLSDISGQASVKLFAEKLTDIISDPYPVGTAKDEISASIGIAMYPEDATTSNVLLKRADEAMYKIKNSGRNGFGFASDKY